MLRRLKFIMRTRGLVINNRRFVHELAIVFLALFAFLATSHLTPTVIHQLKQKGRKDNPGPEFVRMRTRPRVVSESEDRSPYTGHSPYVSDVIMELVLNAEACPGSPSVPLTSSRRLKNGQVLGDKPLTYANLIYNQQSGKDNVDETGNAQLRHTSYSNSSQNNQGYDALFIVCSNVNNATNRNYFRQIYGDVNNTWPYRIKVVFLVGRPRVPGAFENVSREASRFSDIVMGNFLDHYDNLTYKTILGYRWIHEHCRNMDLMLKLDDDVFVDVFKFFDVFRPLIKKQTRTINCFLNKCPRVHRDGKYQVSKEEFAGKKYPPFCSGFFVVPTPDFVDSYVSLYKNIRFFRLEDVFSYGFLRQALVDVQLIHVDQITVESNEYLKCIQRYKYKCKYLAAQVNFRLLPRLMDKMAQFRRSMGLRGSQSGFDELL